MKTFDVEMKIPFGQYTLEEYDIWIAEQTTSMRGMLIAGGFFKDAQSYEEIMKAAIKQSLKEQANAKPRRGGYLNIELNASDVYWDSNGYSRYIAIKDLQYRVLDKGYEGLNITYVVAERSLIKSNGEFRFEAMIPAHTFQDQNSINVTMMSVRRGDYHYYFPNQNTKWGQFFVEVK